MDTLEKVLSRTIYLTVAGSHLYGTNVEGSDYDYKGIAIPTKDYYLGYLKKFEQLERKVSSGHPHDLNVIALWKFVKLAADCNPNIVELLYADEDQICIIDSFGEELRGIRDLFITKKARHTFAGYAYGQLRRIKSHRKWLLDPPKAKPARLDFGLSDLTKVSKSELGAFNSLLADGVVELPSDILTLFLRERQYQAAMANWDSFVNWQANRNPARHAMEAKFGFDLKHGMHLIRLLRMCLEILSTGKVLVKRPDAEELIAIRSGAWTYDQLVDHAESLDKRCDELYRDGSPLPNEPDRTRIDDFTVDLTERYLSSR